LPAPAAPLMLTTLSREPKTNSTTCLCSGFRRPETMNRPFPKGSHPPIPRLMQSIISRLFGLAWVNFQVMRRTHSSLLKELNVDPHIRAEQMGHTVDVNENVYTITSINRQKEAVNVLERALEA
jgi:hypothetical protein